MARIILEGVDADVIENGAFRVQQAQGQYYGASRNGRLFVATSLTGGIALIVAATTGNHPTLWNPSGSGRNISVVSLDLAYVSGANAPGSLAWNYTKRAGSQAGTASPILTFTRVDVESAMLGGAVDSKALWAPAVSTYTAAPAYGRPIKLSLFTGLAATATIPFVWGEEYNGKLNLAPGNAISLVTQQATTTALFRVTVVFEEIDE
ncbi:hypothetical protein LCGC14_2555810 [marine sediment metagenome]|uniref:Uncharacterized protein n=1 Tax=marine sediment metagenome TaxID=412755 RepID=A0A0F9AM26_9ZZZZ